MNIKEYSSKSEDRYMLSTANVCSCNQCIASEDMGLHSVVAQLELFMSNRP